MTSQFSDLARVCHYESDIKKIDEILKEGIIDINHIGENGFTALMYAAAPVSCECCYSVTSKKEVIVYLLNKGAKVNLKDKLGLTAVDYLKQHLDPEWKNDSGECAVKNYTEAQIKMFEELIELMEALL